MIEGVIITVYFVAMFFVVSFSLGQLSLTFFYIRSKKTSDKSTQTKELDTYPFVTIQLPVYNEKYVIKRLIDSVASLDYPTDRFEIQILDDSSDETIDVISGRIAFYKNKGINIYHIQRDNREGYKAGALQYGLNSAKGEFIAIFDADFIPEKNFLKITLPHFSDKKTGMVQTRWGHINEKYSLFTRLQAFGLDAHFSVEQRGRSYAGSYINFNGTAGIWRKSCIEDAGGWHYDILSEDLDLSYRAQLKGWEFKYLEEVKTPAELPVLISAIKTQQYRWNKGAAETARKNLIQVFKSSLPGLNKTHAMFHLMNSTFLPFLFLSSFLSVPMLFIKAANPQYSIIFKLASIFVIGFIAIAVFYWVSFKNTHHDGGYMRFLKEFILFIAFSLGLSLHNGIAVLEGWMGIKTPFIRTPKFNITDTSGAIQNDAYIKWNLSWATVFEGLLFLYFVFGIGAGVYLHDYGLILFHLLLAAGFAGVFIASILPVKFHNRA